MELESDSDDDAQEPGLRNSPTQSYSILQRHNIQLRKESQSMGPQLIPSESDDSIRASTSEGRIHFFSPPQKKVQKRRSKRLSLSQLVVDHERMKRQGKSGSAIRPDDSHSTVEYDLDREVPIKIMLIGNRGVGRTELLYHLCDPSRPFRGDGIKRPFDDIRSVEMCFRRVFVADVPMRLQLLEVSHEKTTHTGFESSIYRNARAVIAVYDVTNERSFMELPAWVAVAQAFSPKEAVLVVVGTKSDLARQREVSFDRGKEYATLNRGLFFEVSCKTDAGIEVMLYALLLKVLEKHQNLEETKPTGIRQTQ